MQLIDGIPVFGDPDPGALEQIKRTARGAQQVALMADNHLGYGVPIGGVAGYVEAISPTGVGYDIACGNKAIRLDMTRRDLNSIGIERAMDRIWTTLSFGLGRRNAEPVDHELFDDDAWQLPAYRSLRDKAAVQLGTIGTGNHYVDLLADEQDRLWVGVHFGSRGFGHGVATHVLHAAGARDTTDAEPLVLSAHSALGEEYLAGMRLAGRYAYASRDWVCARTARLLGAKVVEEVHNHHNFAWQENHGGLDMWVVRKGATPAWPGQRGFVGGSMGDISVILEGVLDEAQSQLGLTPNEYAMFSTVHGAGRVMSRGAAAGKSKRKWVQDPEAAREMQQLAGSIGKLPRGSKERRAAGIHFDELRRRGHYEETISRPGAISQQMLDEWLAREKVVLRGGGLDEAPQAYRRLPEVLAEHAGTIRILHELKPLGVAMAGPDVRDPYKD